MLKHRVIPCLLLQNGGLVKTRRFEDPKYVGDPINAIRIFNDKEVDELIVIDIRASRSGAEPDYAVVQDLASECFMPLCYGGGITAFSQAQRLFALGVEKVSVQTAALRDLRIVTEIASAYGSQAAVIAIDVKRNVFGRPKLYSSSARETLPEPWTDFLRRAVDAGAGEVLLNSVDRDGMMQGYDFELIRAAAAAVDVPVIALGGAGSLAHLKDAVAAGAHAVAAGSFFVFQGPHRAVLITYPEYQELVRLFG